jgi:DNA-binding CsgD family transcriptional regulator
MYEFVKHILMTLLLVSIAPLVSLSVFLYWKRRRRSLGFFVLFFLGVFAYVFQVWLVSTGPAYLAAPPAGIVLASVDAFGAAGVFGILVFGFLFVHSILEKAVNARITAVYSVMSGAAAFASFFLLSFGQTILIPLLMVGLFIYSIARMLVSWTRMGDPALKTALRVTLWLLCAYIPLAVLLLFHVTEILDMTAFLAIQALTIAQMILSLVLWSRYFDREPYVVNQSLAGAFIEQFGITVREKEIIECILRGLDNKGISAALRISTKTTANLLSKIFRKTGVKSRIQLVSLVHGTQV